MKREARQTFRKLTPAEQQRLETLRQEVAQELPELIRRDRQRKQASEAETPSGILRRAIHESEQTLTQIANQAGIEPLQLDDFLTGESTLPSDAIDRLAKVLDCRLVPQK